MGTSLLYVLVMVGITLRQLSSRVWDVHYVRMHVCLCGCASVCMRVFVVVECSRLFIFVAVQVLIFMGM